MNNKKCRLFLLICLAFFVLSVILIISGIISSYNHIKTRDPYDPYIANQDFAYVLAVVQLLILPILLVELSFIRSVYKIIKHRPRGWVKVCYIISSLLTFLAVVFQWLLLLGLINFEQDIELRILEFTEWPVIIVTFLLGSISIKHRD